MQMALTNIHMRVIRFRIHFHLLIYNPIFYSSSEYFTWIDGYSRSTLRCNDVFSLTDCQIRFFWINFVYHIVILLFSEFMEINQ